MQTTAIKQLVSRLTKKYGTNDPIEIAAHRNILVLYDQLGETLGYFHTYKRISMIHINSNMEDWLQRFVCAHELGHALQHPKVNTPFLKKNTCFSIDRIEREANEFAVELLMPDEILCEYSTIVEVAAACGIPLEVSHLKKTLTIHW